MFNSVCIYKFLSVTMLGILVVKAQPLSCKEDAHCSEGYYCEIQSNICQECLRCQDLKRYPPKLDTTTLSNICIKSVDTCGPCTEGFTNIYGNGVKGKCVTPELLEFESPLHYAYIWTTAAVTGVLIVAIFVYVIRHTDVYQIVAYYSPVLDTSPSDDTASSPKHLLKSLLSFNTAIKSFDM